MTSLIIGNIQVVADAKTVSWISGMAIDADGAPNCYAPKNSGLVALDSLRNAGKPGHWYGIAKDANGVPFIQGSEDPFPGYYVATTAFGDHTKAESDPRRYVDARRVPYISVPPQLRKVGVRMGDIAWVENHNNGLICPAICADVGPEDSIGEGSLYLAEQLHIEGDAHWSAADDGILFTIYLKTSKPWPRTNEDISAQARALLG